ncbi:hypothetical protein KJQ85_06710 [Campylobacter lari]|uniref:hypothetical protein n=1 Tax=Campylobacter lari TaxID=201 RepID=UPI00126F481A|nr:hypothetical protein [Campylobacter lari]MBT0826748.1 hypothetical protein [Campylobacter lari]MBT0832032.1 hypothetical protein [Campylobacter lari]
MNTDKIFDYMADNASKWINKQLTNAKARSYGNKLVLEVDGYEFFLSDHEIHECSRLYEESLKIDSEKLQDLGFENFEIYDDYCAIVFEDYKMVLELTKEELKAMEFNYLIEDDTLFIYQNDKSLEQAMQHYFSNNKNFKGNL